MAAAPASQVTKRTPLPYQGPPGEVPAGLAEVLEPPDWWTSLRRWRLERAWEVLGDRRRAVLRYTVAGLTPEDIAAQQGVSKARVMALQHEGLTALWQMACFGRTPHPTPLPWTTMKRARAGRRWPDLEVPPPSEPTEVKRRPHE